MEFQYRDCTSRVYIFLSLTHTHPFLTRLTAICPQVQHEGLKTGSQTRGILAVSTCNISPTTQFLVELGVCCSEEDLRGQQGLLEPAPPPADVFILALHSELSPIPDHSRQLFPRLCGSQVPFTCLPLLYHLTHGFPALPRPCQLPTVLPTKNVNQVHVTLPAPKHHASIP